MWTRMKMICFSTFDSNVEQNIFFCFRKLSIRYVIFSREMNSFTNNQPENEPSLLHSNCILFFFCNSMDENFQIFFMFELVWMNHISHAIRHAPRHLCRWPLRTNTLEILLTMTKIIKIFFSEINYPNSLFQKASFNELGNHYNHQ